MVENSVLWTRFSSFNYAFRITNYELLQSQPLTLYLITGGLGKLLWADNYLGYLLIQRQGAEQLRDVTVQLFGLFKDISHLLVGIHIYLGAELTDA